MTLATSPQPSVSPGPATASATGVRTVMPYLPPLGPAPAEAGPHRFSREQYYLMAELGFFQDRHVELIDGVIVDMSPQTSLHANTVMRCIRALDRAFGNGFMPRSQANLRLGNADPEPDVAVLTLAESESPLPAQSALLIVEVSLTSLVYDRGDKASLYAAAGIGDYWIVNLNNNTLEVRRQPLPDAAARFGHGYGQLMTLTPAETVSPLALPGANITVNAFFEP